ncbi:MAG TPA: hypothetical protein VG275_10745 [Solirubrobacteraceae bacterium]|jgi:hypothetical protein|nr:hypothetical protein [Solirubrobacteraceae bacterium]
MEVTTEVPQTGTRLMIDADRDFDTPSGDSVLRVRGERRDGAQVLDAAYVEVDGQEAQAIAQALRQIRQPTPELHDEIAREVQAAFGARLGARDASQIAQIVSRAWWQHLGVHLGTEQQEREQRLQRLAERFERASAKRRGAPSQATQEPPSRGKAG